jgi:hypothetical protein
VNRRLEAGVPVLTFRLEHPRPVIRGDDIAIVVEKSPYSATTANWEDHALAVSQDGGKTFSPLLWVTQIGWHFNQGLGDVDAEGRGRSRIVMTPNRDIMCAWPDNRAYATNEINEAFAGGLKLPDLGWRGAGQGGFEIEWLTASHAGQVALILVTEAGTAPVLPLGNMGFQLNFAIGQYTFPILGAGAAVFLATVGPTGQTTFPNAPAIPPTTLTFHALGLGIDPTGLTYAWFTDPVRYK